MSPSTLCRVLRRTTLYAAFAADGEPVLNVWDWDRKRLDRTLSDRAANGHAMPGEHVVRCTVEFYRRKLTEWRLPVAAELLP